MLAAGRAPKRCRSGSDECSFSGQSKQFVNQTRVDAQNADKMQQIYSKTVSMLFAGVSNHFNQLQQLITIDTNNNGTADGNKPIAVGSTAATQTPAPNDTKNVDERMKFVRLLGDGQFVMLLGGKTSDIIPVQPDLMCLSCARASRLRGKCNNCGTSLCECCGFGCVECATPLCSNCVCLFDCGTNENPCCSSCQMFA